MTYSMGPLVPPLSHTHLGIGQSSVGVRAPQVNPRLKQAFDLTQFYCLLVTCLGKRLILNVCSLIVVGGYTIQSILGITIHDGNIISTNYKQASVME
jgi:hypothetical protein